MPEYSSDSTSSTQADSERLCQIATIPHLGQPIPDRELESMTIRSWIKLYLKRTLSSKTKRMLKMKFDGLTGWFQTTLGRKTASIPLEVSPASIPQEVTTPSLAFKAGDLVRIRPMKEIEATLNNFGELKGCGFMDGMDQYCGTTQRVWKPVLRFVDERDYKVKRTKGIYLLEGLVCQGTKMYGRCDRSCFFFWREEWLEKVE